MSFPKQFLGFPIGWRKLGSSKGWHFPGLEHHPFPGGPYIHQSPDGCDCVLDIGLENDIPFLYCPKCLVKIKEIK